jgi:Family of unknown function (DUF6261)
MDINNIETAKKIDASLKCYNYLTAKLATDPVIMAMAEIMKEKIEKINFGPKNEKFLTQDMQAIDNKRDDIYKSIYYILKSHANYTLHTELQKNISVLSSKICESGIAFLAGSYRSESTWITEKIGILRDPQFAQTIETLGLTQYVNNLDESEKEFIQMYEDRKDLKEQRPVAIHKVMPELNKAIIAIESYINLKYDEATHKACFEPFELAEKPEKIIKPEVQ